MTLEHLIGQFKAYTEYPNQDTFVISNQECKDILKYLTELQTIKDEPPTDDWEHYADRLWVRAYERGYGEFAHKIDTIIGDAIDYDAIDDAMGLLRNIKEVMHNAWS